MISQVAHNRLNYVTTYMVTEIKAKNGIAGGLVRTFKTMFIKARIITSGVFCSDEIGPDDFAKKPLAVVS
jgi:hypothetical protein